MYKYLPLLFLPLFFSCKGNTEVNNSNNTYTKSIITPPLKGDFINDAIFKIDPTIKNKLETNNGSNFTIPANALVNENGELISQEVTITFNQYHSVADIISSGIPMTYDSLGQSANFESAGMFTINGMCNTQPVFVKEGKNIHINLASDFNAQEPFNFYELNENTGDWTYEHSDTPIERNPNFDRANYLPNKPEPVLENAFIIDVNFDLSNFSELAIFSGIVWEYTGMVDSLDPRLNKKASTQKWTDFDLVPTHQKAYEYYMTMKNKQTAFTTKVKAALDGEDLEKAMAEFAAEKTNITKQLEDLQKPYIRSVAIAGFGTYNYDYIHNITAPQQVMADFNFEGHNYLKDEALVVLVYEEDNYIVNYPKDKWASFGVDTKAKAKLFAILSDNKVAVFNGDISECYGQNAFTFNMQVLDKKIDDKNMLIDVLASL